MTAGKRERGGRGHRKPEKPGICTDEVMRLDAVSKIYNTGGEDFYALRNVNLTIRKCDFTSILGPSGSGKSTLLHIVGLLDRPSRGRVFIDGIETSSMSPVERARIRGRKVGFVFQQFNLIPSLTSIENVKMPLLISEVPEPLRTQKAKKVLESLNMGDRLNHYPNQLSGGQKQRVAIARALVNDPDIIMADEPTGNLDSKSGQEVFGIFRRLHDEGKTMLIISHNPGITRITHKTIHIRDGMITEKRNADDADDI